MEALADKVRRERLRRGWSVRRAASEGDISNTWWGNFEDYRQPLTPTIAAAVALAFGWDEDWPDEVELVPDFSRFDAVEKTVLGLVAIVDRLCAITKIEMPVLPLPGPTAGDPTPPATRRPLRPIDPPA